MERKGGCCLVPRYGGGAGAGGQQTGMAWQMGKIMLKFRPIAPKPAAMEPAPTLAPVAAPTAGAGAGSGKRKAAGGGGGRRGRKPKKAAMVSPVAAVPAVAAQEVGDQKDCEKKSLSSRSSSSSGTTSVDSSPPPPRLPATLLLMPVSPVEEMAASAAAAEEPAPVASLVAAPAAGGQPVAPRALCPVSPALSPWVTMEDVTATWRDGEAPSDAAAAAAACCGGDDEAPAFVSDQWGRVTWANAAFLRAVYAGSDEEAARVGLAGALPAWGTCAGFTCRLRVARHRRGGPSVVAPCDVWRLDAGGCYLWRLDLQAALTLGGFS